MSEEGSPLSQSPWDEPTADVYSSSSRLDTAASVTPALTEPIKPLGVPVYHFVALSLALSRIVLGAVVSI